MEKVRMTVHEALCEIKVADKKIYKAINEATFCTSSKASNNKINGVDIKEYTDHMQADYQKIMDLIRRTEAIKAAISLSNASTKISVAGKEMTVAEGIYMMQYGMDTKALLKNTMAQHYADAIRNVENQNRIIETERLDKFIASTFGNKEKANPTDLAVASEAFLKQQRFELVDPLGVKEKIDALEDEIDEFKAKIDSAIQISNATTYIEFEY